MKTEIVGVTHLAGVLGISVQRVRAMIKQGILEEAIVERPKTKTGGYRLDLAISQDCVSKYLSVRNDSQVKAGRSGTGKRAGLSDRDRLLKAQIRKELATAKMREMEVAIADGKLVDGEAVRAVAFARGRIIRDAMMNLPDRTGDILAAESDPVKIRAILNKEIRIALEGLNHGTI
jgi:hypothetical protein